MPNRPVPAYSITEVEVLDRDEFTRYRELAAAAVSRYGGRFLVRGRSPLSRRAGGHRASA
jgi:uncharacterized protein (DUF1330 family)